MAITDEQIGKNIRRVRGDKSQKDVAAAMSDRGWKWSQSTVWSVEKGERPLRVAEAEDLATILGTFTHYFTLPDPESRVHEYMLWMVQANKELSEAISQFYTGQVNLAMIADAYESELWPSTLEGVRGWLMETPATVATRIRQREQMEGNIDNFAHLGDDEEAKANMRLIIEQSRATNGPMMKLHEQIYSGNGEHSEAS
jgi:hypothetical protein